MEKKILDFNKILENIVNRNFELIGEQARELQEQYSIESSAQLEKDMEMLSKEGRLIKIGFIGRVKAGKSSLLNSLLFNGESILPKAATPMTAALTVISHSDSNDFNAQVEFYTKNDIQNIEKEALEYNVKFNKLFDEKYKKLKEKGKTKDENEIKLNAEKSAKRELKENIKLTASFEQYEQMKKSGLLNETRNSEEEIHAKNLDELKENLINYVGNEGQYMPFTKSVHIKLPIEKLKNLEIIDTPGINDPVVSREERTRKLLKLCDIIFVVSPAGQFINSEDKNLMDRISTREGVNEVFVVASQVDNQLFGNEKEKNNGELPKILKSIENILEEQLVSNIKQIKSDNPEIGSVFDGLTNGNKLFLTSGISMSIKLLFKNREKWDEGMEHVWNNLKEEYGEYFSEDNIVLSEESLERLANIGTINNAIEEVGIKKDKIVQDKKSKFLNHKWINLKKYKDELLKTIDENIKYVENSDLVTLLAQKKEIENKSSELKYTVGGVYDDEIAILIQEIKDKTGGYLNNKKEILRKIISDSEGNKIVGHKIELDGLLNNFCRILGTGGHETVYEDRMTLNVTPIRNGLEDLTYEIQNSLTMQINSLNKVFEKNLQEKLVTEIKKILENVEAELLRTLIRRVLRGLKTPEYNEELLLPDELNKYGKIEGEDAKKYFQSAHSYTNDLVKSFYKKVGLYLEDLNTVLKIYNPIEEINKNMADELDKIINEVENKKITIERLSKIKKELEGAKKSE